jgi:hypothetical protein
MGDVDIWHFLLKKIAASLQCACSFCFQLLWGPFVLMCWSLRNTLSCARFWLIFSHNLVPFLSLSLEDTRFLGYHSLSHFLFFDILMHSI